MSNMPTQEELLARFAYDPETGELTNRQNGKQAFATVMTNGGYKRGKLGGRFLRAHRVIWKMVHGVEPGVIDHINGNPADNRLCNLRAVTQLENQRNRRKSRNNKSGFNGVHWKQREAKWGATIRIDGKWKGLGLYADIADAVSARRAAEAALGYSARHGL